MRRSVLSAILFVVFAGCAAGVIIGVGAGVQLGTQLFGGGDGAAELVGCVAGVGLPCIWLTCVLALAQERAKSLQVGWDAPFLEMGFEAFDRLPSRRTYRRSRDAVEVRISHNWLAFLVIEVQRGGRLAAGVTIVPSPERAHTDLLSTLARAALGRRRPLLLSVGVGVGAEMVRSPSFEAAAMGLFERSHFGRVSLSTVGGGWVWRWVGYPLENDPVLSPHNLESWIRGLAEVDAVPGPWHPPAQSSTY